MVDNQCLHVPVVINDNNACTVDTCHPQTGVKHTHIHGCRDCTTAQQCNDQNPCTTDTCHHGVCKWTKIKHCCIDDDECNDGKFCTVDRCVHNRCKSTRSSESSTDCDEEETATTTTIAETRDDVITEVTVVTIEDEDENECGNGVIDADEECDGIVGETFFQTCSFCTLGIDTARVIFVVVLVAVLLLCICILCCLAFARRKRTGKKSLRVRS